VIAGVLSLQAVLSLRCAASAEALPGSMEKEALPVKAGLVRAGAVLGTLSLPDVDLPAGLVLLLPDSLGHDPRGAPYVAQLLRSGLAALDVLQGGDDAEALARALPELLAQAGAKTLPVGVIGFGAGARVALRLGPGIAARVLLYPGCVGLTGPEAPQAAPTLLLYGGTDQTNPHEACIALAARLARSGTVRRFIYPGAGYAWDYPAYGQDRRILLPRPDGQGTIPSRPWPELTAMSAAQATDFLAAMFAVTAR